MASDIIHFAFLAFAHHEVDGLAVVFNVEPVSYVVALAVYGQLLAFEDVVN